MLHALLQHFDRRSHRTDDSPSDNALRQLQMMETEQLHALVEVQQTFGNVVQAEKFFVATIDVIDCNSSALYLIVKGLTQRRTDVQQRQKSRRVQPTAVSQARANQVVVVRGDCLEHVQQRDRLLDHLVGASNQPRRVEKISLLDIRERSLQIERGAFHQQL